MDSGFPLWGGKPEVVSWWRVMSAYVRAASVNSLFPNLAEPAPKSCLEGGAPAPPRGPVVLTFGAYELQHAAVSVRHVLRPCGSMALQKALRVSRKISEIRD
jgi:hypothetical protein